MNSAAPTYCYTFSFPDKKTLVFSIPTDCSTLDTSGNGNSTKAPPSWCKLHHHRCTPCTLEESIHTFCPIALRVAELVPSFNDIVSYAPCIVRCQCSERTVIKETVVQEGLASIMGLIMASSGCPVMSFFKPLARFHLPFASVEESVFRVAAVYMLQRYYKKKFSDIPFSFEQIKAHYGRVRQVNQGMLKRLRDITNLDADKNALVSLTSLAQILEIEFEENLRSLQDLFENDI